LNQSTVDHKILTIVYKATVHFIVFKPKFSGHCVLSVSFHHVLAAVIGHVR
jgi:hypothetical protein